MPTLRLHGLRHTWVSLLLASGVPLAIVSKMAGHSSVGVTVDLYGHLLEGAGQQVAAAVGAMVPRRAS